MSYTVKEQREIILAYEQGEEVEWKSINVPEWSPIPPKEQFKASGYGEPQFDFIHNCYRVKPKRWRDEKGNRYFSVSGCGEVFSSSEDWSTTDDSRYDFGNYFRTREDAERARDQIKELLTKFHESL